MTEASRRVFLQALGAGAVASALPGSIARALSIPAASRTGTINDVEHIVILMQENRSFDSYFGSLRGVRGFSDPRAVSLPSGNLVWYQPTGSGTSYVLPFRPAVTNAGLTFVQDVSHTWTSSHGAWNNGKYDQWIPNKGTTTMAYYTRKDVPFQYALADAFTICDAYHCSLMGPTDPNRYHLWTGWCGNDGQGGGPVIDNAEVGYDWSTFPEKMQAAGITWKVYQDVGTGLTAAGYWGWTSNPYIGNYGDNSLLYFHQYQNAASTDPLAMYARTGTDIAVSGTLFDVLRADVMNNTLPQVSYITAPEAYSEHPNWTPDFGAWYVSQVLDALTSNPQVWSKTVVFYGFDEAGGFFDHMVPPTPPQSRAQGESTVSTINEIFPGSSKYAAGPYGLGTRVPMIVISPWSKGGYVCSEVFDHTSLIKFIETRFGAATNPALVETNITPWRRAVVGDMTSAFNFHKHEHGHVPLPNTNTWQPSSADITTGLRFPDYVPVVPATQTMPTQEPGLRWARPLPYRLFVHGVVDTAHKRVAIRFGNLGTAGVVYQVRSGDGVSGPWIYTVTPHTHAADVWPVSASTSLYDLTVYGSNGFLRAFKGSVASGAAHLDVNIVEDHHDDGLRLMITNSGAADALVTIKNAYSSETETQTIAAGAAATLSVDLRSTYGWYDLTVTVGTDSAFHRQLAGHVETGRDSVSDPMIGGLGEAP